MKLFLLLLQVTLAMAAATLPYLCRNSRPGEYNPSFNFFKGVMSKFLGHFGRKISSLKGFGAEVVEKHHVDYVVVGGGAAGTVMSYRLVEAGYSVALIERGTYHKYSKPEMPSIPGLGAIFAGATYLKEFAWTDWELFVDSQQGDTVRTMHFPQGKGLGGSSFVGHMLYQKAPRSFFDKWAEMAEDDSYRLDEFEQFYDKSTTVHARDGIKRSDESSPYNATASGTEARPIHVSYPKFTSKWATWFEKALKGAGIKGLPENSDTLMGYQYAQMNIQPEGASKSSAAEFIHTAVQKNLTKLKIYPDTRASSINIEVGKATGVWVRSVDIKTQITAEHEVIVCAGALRSPHLLMRSGIGPREILKEHHIKKKVYLSGVGQNMWDHVYFGVSFPVKLETTDSALDLLGFDAALDQYKTSADGPLTSNGLELLGYEKLPKRYRQLQPETQAKLSKFPADWPEVEYIAANGYMGNYQVGLFKHFNDTHYATILGGLSAPLSRGNITLPSKRSKRPTVNPNWLSDRGDQEVAVAWVKRVRDLWESGALDPIRKGVERWPGTKLHTDPEILKAIRSSFLPAGHPAGTCKMGGLTDTTAVVDNEARVYGVRGLRVVDASSMPLLPPGHPIATIYAFAEKIAASIIRERRIKDEADAAKNSNDTVQSTDDTAKNAPKMV